MSRGKIIKLQAEHTVEPAFKNLNGLGARTGVPLRLGGENISLISRASTGEFRPFSSSLFEQEDPPEPKPSPATARPAKANPAAKGPKAPGTKGAETKESKPSEEAPKEKQAADAVENEAKPAEEAPKEKQAAEGERSAEAPKPEPKENPLQALAAVLKGIGKEEELHSGLCSDQAAWKSYKKSVLSKLDAAIPALLELDSPSAAGVDAWQDKHLVPLADGAVRFLSVLHRLSRNGDRPAGALLKDLEARLYIFMNMELKKIGWRLLQRVTPFKDKYNPKRPRHEVVGSLKGPKSLAGRIVEVREAGFLSTEGKARQAKVVIGEEDPEAEEDED